MGVINHMVIRGQFISLLVSVFIILIIMSVVLKSLSGGFLATLPMIVSVSMMFGLMGYLGITLNITTSLLTCILVGGGVDYTVHFLWHLKDHINDGDSFEEAITNTFRISGKGILFNGLSVVVGFSALLGPSAMELCGGARVGGSLHGNNGWLKDHRINERRI